MTRILGMDLLTGSYSNLRIQYAICLVDTLNRTSKLYENQSVDQIIELLQTQTLDIIAIDHINELRIDNRLFEYLIDIEYLILKEISQYGTSAKSLIHLANEHKITLKSKPNPLKSAIICALLAENYGTTIELTRKNGRIEIIKNVSQIPKQGNILNKKVKSALTEQTHKKTFEDLSNSMFVDEIEQVIGYGKEAIVYRVRDINGKNIVAKSFRTYSSIARRIHSETYKAKIGHIPLLMARDEAKYLSLLNNNDISVPKFYFRDDNVVFMEAILDEHDDIAPTLAEIDENNYGLDEIQDMLYQGLDLLYNLFKEVNVVHGDYSANNILVRNDELVLIDLSQAMQINKNTYVETPLRLRMDKALDTVFRDLNGFLTFFENHFRVHMERDVIFDQFSEIIPDPFIDKVFFTLQSWKGKFTSI